jgi:hypothetical protein
MYSILTQEEVNIYSLCTAVTSNLQREILLVHISKQVYILRGNRIRNPQTEIVAGALASSNSSDHSIQAV